MQPLSSNKVWKGEIFKKKRYINTSSTIFTKEESWLFFLCIYGRIPFKRQTQRPIQETQILGTSALFFNMYVAVSEIYKM